MQLSYFQIKVVIFLLFGMGGSFRNLPLVQWLSPRNQLRLYLILRMILFFIIGIVGRSLFRIVIDDHLLFRVLMDDRQEDLYSMIAPYCPRGEQPAWGGGGGGMNGGPSPGDSFAWVVGADEASSSGTRQRSQGTSTPESPFLEHIEPEKRIYFFRIEEESQKKIMEIEKDPLLRDNQSWANALKTQEKISLEMNKILYEQGFPRSTEDIRSATDIYFSLETVEEASSSRNHKLKNILYEVSYKRDQSVHYTLIKEIVDNPLTNIIGPFDKEFQKYNKY